MSKNKLTIKKILEKVGHNDYLLPEIQREFVWKPQQIQRLFDSLMRGYPIGTIVFWKIKKALYKELIFYHFIDRYDQREETSGTQAKPLENTVTTVVDGQQRITSFNIGFRGEYVYKTKRKSEMGRGAYVPRYLCLAIQSTNKKILPKDLEDLEYPFVFLSNQELEEKEVDGEKWIKLSDVFYMKDKRAIKSYLNKKNLSGKKTEILLSRLYDVLNEDIITYKDLENKTLPEIFKIFDRLNTGGIQLSPSDVAYSQFITSWPSARMKVHDLVERLNEKDFSFDKDLVLKSCLVLSGLDVKFKASSFAEYIRVIKTNWSAISKALIIAVNLISRAGYSEKNLTSKNAIIPIAHYIFKARKEYTFVSSGHSDAKNDRERIILWFKRALIARAFSGQSDEALRISQKVIDDYHGAFPIDELSKKFDEINKPLIFSSGSKIRALLDSKKDEKHTFSVLSFLYPNLNYSRNNFHMDHIFPKALFKRNKLLKFGVKEEDIEKYIEKRDCIANLQLLEGQLNEEKLATEPQTWVDDFFHKDKKGRLNYLTSNYLSSNKKLIFKNFLKIHQERENELYDQFQKVLLKKRNK